MIFSSRNYAIGMAHYRISGGLQSLVILCVGFAVIVCSVLGLVLYNVLPAMIVPALGAAGAILLVLQSFALVMFGSARIASCIRVDVATNMIESHRQMPISSWRVMLGYLFGGNSHVLAVALVNLVILSIVQGLAKAEFNTVVMSHLVLAWFALFLWTFTAMGTFMFKQAAPLMVLGVVFGSFTGVFLRSFGILPGLTLLASPFLGETIFSLGGPGSRIREAYPLALGAQAAFGSLFFIGACRRYRGSYLTTFNVGMGVALIAIWGLLSAGAIPQSRELFLPGRGFRQPLESAQVVAALTVSAILMMIPIFSLATWEFRHPLKGTMRFLAVAGIIVSGSLPMLGDTSSIDARLPMTFLILSAHVLTIYGIFRLTRGASPMFMGICTIGLLFAIWVLPFILEAVRWLFLPQNSYGIVDNDLTFLSTASPVGLLYAFWCSPIPSHWQIGLAFQLLAAAVLWTLGSRRHARFLTLPNITATAA